MQLRQAGVVEPVLLLSEPVPGAMHDVVAGRLTPTLYTPGGVEAAVRAVAAYGGREPLAVHVKVDTGMHRVGAHPEVAAVLAERVAAHPSLRLEGLFTHLAVADEPDDPFTGEQLARFRRVLDELDAVGVRPELLHAANSAGAIVFPDARFDLVRCGIALYGLAPAPVLEERCEGLVPALTLKARVSYVKRVDAGERVSYGLRYRLDRPATIATVPIGYADGVPRRLSEVGGEVLIGGRRHRIAGTVTMDQITVDCGDDVIAVGDEVVLIGRQGEETITAWEWAERLGTIAYEIVVRPERPRSPRLPGRGHHGRLRPAVLTDVPGIRVGHWSHPEARTGCTTVLFPAGTVASGEVRGGAPGTREWELLHPARLVRRIDAPVLSGGSAFGLAACDGVVRWCEERGVGLPTVGGPVPIVVGAVLFDLGVGDPRVRPGPEQGYAACEAAVTGPFATGAVGAGTGATINKWRGPDGVRPGGLGTASAVGPGGLIVAALIACNAWGTSANRAPRRSFPPDSPAAPAPWDEPLANTTIGVIATNARLDKLGCLLVAQSGHDGLARSLAPVHATVDGDALVAAATGTVEVPDGPVGLEQVRSLAAGVVETAVRAAS